jgi:hypothetical protein
MSTSKQLLQEFILGVVNHQRLVETTPGPRDYVNPDHVVDLCPQCNDNEVNDDNDDRLCNACSGFCPDCGGSFDGMMCDVCGYEA